MEEIHIWYDDTLNVGISCYISYYQRRPVCMSLFLDGVHVPDFRGYISWLAKSLFILEPHAPSEKVIRSMIDVPDKWDGRFMIPHHVGVSWCRYLEPVS